MKYKNILFIISLVSVLVMGTMHKAIAQDTLAVVSGIDIEKIKSLPDLQLSNTFQGQAAGLIPIPGTGALGSNSSTFYIRGQHTTGNNNAVVIVDGLERDINDLLPEEIESIEILKDATAKILYGAQATNGVVLIKTKRGFIGKRQIRVGVEYGIQPVTRVPSFLDANNYISLFNEACENDGIMPMYSASEIEGYRNSSGPNDFYYPTADYYSTFLQNYSEYRKGTVEFKGGNKNSKYSLFVGYTGGTGLEKIGPKQNMNRFNVRGNLDMQINEILSVSADVAARIELKNRGNVSASTLFEKLSTHRPNEYAFLINPLDISTASGGTILVNEDDLIFGANERYSSNLYGDVVYGGDIEERYVNSQTNLGLNFNLSGITEGLSADAYVTFDNYSYLRKKLTNTYDGYSVERYNDVTGQEVLTLVKRRKLNLPKNYGIDGNSTYRIFGWNGYLNYDRNFGNSSLFAKAGYRYTMEEVVGENQDMKESNLSLNLNYSYDKRYIIDLTASLMGSNKFIGSNNKLFPAYAAGFAWVLSNESFMDDASWIDNLTLKASMGHLGFAGNTGHFLYSTNWKHSSSQAFTANRSTMTNQFVRLGNPNLEWEYSNEYNVGLTWSLLETRLSGEFNVFSENRKNIIGTSTTTHSGVAGSFLFSENIGSVLNKGVEFAANWQDTRGDFSYSIGYNVTITKNKITAANELASVEEYRSSLGKPTSTIFGLESQGLFGKTVPLENHAKQAYSLYTIGDIAYADLNNDGVVDDHDRMSIGQSFPVTTMGLNFDVNYKGFGLYVLGVASMGVTQIMNGAYFWNNDVNGYSTLALDRYHPINNPSGTQPRLTTTSGGNNFRNSTFWAADGSFIRLKNIELSYTFNNRKDNAFGQNLKVYVRGANLFTISEIKDLDPELLSAGVSYYPNYSTYTVGVSVNF